MRLNTMPRPRKSLAILCIALVVFAAFVPAVASQFCAVLTALWLVVPAIAIILLRRRALQSDEQPAALLSLVLFRAPPASPAFA